VQVQSGERASLRIVGARASRIANRFIRPGVARIASPMRMYRESLVRRDAQRTINWPTCMRANVLKRATIRSTTKRLHHARHIAKLHRARTVRPDGTAALVHASAGLVFFVPSIT